MSEMIKGLETTRGKVLTEAINTVCHDRDDQYGTPEDNFATIARMWTAYIKASCVPSDCDVYIYAHDVAAMLALLKIARIATGKPKLDSWVDLAGYAACGAEAQHV